MPPKAPPPSASAASKGKGKEGASTTTASSSSNAASSSATATATASTSSTPSANASAAAQRRQPIGKVIHYFADNQSQGYDGMAFQEAYKTQILAKIQEIQDAKKDEKSEEVELDVSDADLETFISLTGLKKEQAKAYFTKAKSTKLEDACKAYLHPEEYQSSSNGTLPQTNTNGAATVVPAAA